MKRLYMVAAAVPLLAMLASAQTPPDDVTLKKLKLDVEQMVSQSKAISLKGGVLGATVKGAPYSAVEVNESTQVLADGTRIHNEAQTSVFRDTEGRVRRETPDMITIMDPVAGATWILDPKAQTARKAPLAQRVFAFKTSARNSDIGTSTFEMQSKDGITSVMVDGKPADPAMVAGMKVIPDLPMEPGMSLEESKAMLKQRMNVGPGAGLYVTRSVAGPPPGPSESLGTQNIEGVNSEGTRSTTTLPVGAIGNDRPIQTVMERWYSPDLQTIVMTKHSDPRNGDETFRLTNVNRNEPAPYLFQVPSTYQILEGK